MSKGKTFAQVRAEILETIEAIRNKEMSVSVGKTVFEGYRELHNSVQTEINVAKLAMATEGKAHSFGRVVGMGKRVIDGEE